MRTGGSAEPTRSRGPVGVVGAGTMGSGIAQLAAQAGRETLVYDPIEGAAAKGIERALAGIEKLRAKGKLEGEPAAIAAATALDDLARCEVIIEAAPERLDLKHELFGALSLLAPDAVLASNTSSIPITAIARAADDPSRVVGMHFFNPAPLMALLEVIAGVESSDDALDTARALGAAMGKQVIDAADGPGFLVNRCNRPFGLEALRLLQEGVADVETIDRIVRGAGFRMGPFELQDLVGIDVGFEVSKSFFELSFGEPRWRPSQLSAQMVAAGRHGRKTARGWYEYEDGRPHRPDDPPPAEPGGGDGRLVVVAGYLPVAEELRGLADAAGFEVAAEGGGDIPWLIVDCGADPEAPPLQGAPQALLLAEGPLHELDPQGSACGFHALPPIGSVSEVSARQGRQAERFEEFVRAIGCHPVRVRGDSAGLVLGRIVAQVVNECAFAVGEGVGSPADVDTGMRLGMNYPRGPLAWADEASLAHLLLVLESLGEERYRPAPLLRRMVMEGESFHPSHD